MSDDRAAIEQLESRLERGWELIDRAERAADERAASRYTRRWLQLLDEYERLVQPRGHNETDLQAG
jgi:hypothetical protein